MPTDQKPRCFVIAPIGPNDSEIRKRSDKVLKHIFRKALSHKYEVTRGDEIDEPGMITSQVLRAVQESHLVVADLTGHNPNVLYELAVRHAIEKPVIHAIEPKLSKIPFDIAGFRTIEFDLTDPDSIESAVEQLKKQAEQAEKGKWGETPVKLANIMRRSDADPQETVLLKQAVAGIANVSARLTNIEHSVGVGRLYQAFGPVIRQIPDDWAGATGHFGIGLQGLQPPLTVLTPETLAAQGQLRHASQPDDAPASEAKTEPGLVAAHRPHHRRRAQAKPEEKTDKR